MKVVDNDREQSQTLAQMKFCNQLEEDDRSGGSL